MYYYKKESSNKIYRHIYYTLKETSLFNCFIDYNKMSRFLKLSTNKKTDPNMQQHPNTNRLQLKSLENSSLYQRRAHSRENLVDSKPKDITMAESDYESVGYNVLQDSIEKTKKDSQQTITLAQNNSFNLFWLVGIFFS